MARDLGRFDALYGHVPTLGWGEKQMVLGVEKLDGRRVIDPEDYSRSRFCHDAVWVRTALVVLGVAS
jgi:hypothetical protein